MTDTQTDRQIDIMTTRPDQAHVHVGNSQCHSLTICSIHSYLNFLWILGDFFWRGGFGKNSKYIKFLKKKVLLELILGLLKCKNQKIHKHFGAYFLANLKKLHIYLKCVPLNI